MFRVLVCPILLISSMSTMTGCHTENAQGVTAGNSPVRTTDTQWRCQISVSVPLHGKEETYTIEQERNILSVLGITEAKRPIIVAEYGDLHLFLLEVYINRKTTIRGSLLRDTFRDEPWDQEKFHGHFEQDWKLVGGNKPKQEEFYWSGIYRTDGETIYFDALEKGVVMSTWMMTTKAPRKVP